MRDRFELDATNSGTAVLEPVAPQVRIEQESDRSLMKKAVKGDREAFGELFQRLAANLWRMSYYLLHSSTGADDAVQETFMKALEHVGDFRFQSEPKAWFLSIALNTCRRQLQQEKRRELYVGTDEIDRARGPGRRPAGVMTTVLRRERSRRLAIVIGHLSESQREVFVLHYIDGAPYEEVAQLLGISNGAARALAFRAKQILRENL